MTEGKPIFGVTLYSFTNEWKARAFILDGLLEQVASSGLGPAVEVVGFQSFRTYPDISDEFAAEFRGRLEQYGLFASSLGANMDFGRRPNQLMTDDEKIDYIQRQIDSAVKLGFRVLRMQTSVGTEILERFVPLLERANLHMGFELHAPLAVDHPEVIKFRECFDRLQTDTLGFIPDFSTSMTGVPEAAWQRMRISGAPEELIDRAKNIWIGADSIPAKFQKLAAVAADYQAGPGLLGYLNSTMTMFGHMPPENWKELMPYVWHIHGKFYHVTDDGIEPTIPYPRLMNVLRETGYTGTVSAEWEGHAFTNEMLGLGEVERWRKMCDRLLANAPS